MLRILRSRTLAECRASSRGSLLIPPLLAMAYALLGGLLPPLARAVGRLAAASGAPGATAAPQCPPRWPSSRCPSAQRAELPPAAALLLPRARYRAQPNPNPNSNLTLALALALTLTPP